MLSAGRKIFSGLLTAWDGFWNLWLANIFWILLCVPVITLPLAFTGLYFSMHELANGESMEWNTFFTGIRRHFWNGMVWFGFTFAVSLFLLFFLNFFGSTSANFGGAWTDIASGILLGLLTVWLFINTFTFPLMLKQENPSYWTAIRNSAALYLKWPGFTLVFVLFNTLVIVLSVWLIVPLLILGAGLPALMANVYVIDRIEETKKRAA
jgi:hypothetical protein